MAEPYYCTCDQLRAELNVDRSALDDATATKLIEDAEDIIDRLLGGWTPDETTGRKIVAGDVEAWQLAKLARATAKLAARFRQDPRVFETLYESMSGPDFAVTRPIGGAVTRMLGVHVLALLDDSGLRRLAGRATTRRGGIRPEYEQFLRATRHDGT